MSDAAAVIAGKACRDIQVRVAVVGAGPLAAEVVRNLGLAGIPASVHRPEDFWETLRLADLQECYCAVAAGVDRDAARRLNTLCQIAGVDFVRVSLGADGITVESFPFGSDRDCACLECAAPAEDEAAAGPAPDPIAASVAGALAAAAALHCSAHGARRLSMPALHVASTTAPVTRRPGCPACSPLSRLPRVIRTRNCWSAREPLAAMAPELCSQPVRLSDAVVTAFECTACGPVEVPAGTINRRDAGPGPGAPACPHCGSRSVRIEVRDSFSLGDLMARFGNGPVPAKFALADIGGVAVCFDLDAGAARNAGGAG